MTLIGLRCSVCELFFFSKEKLVTFINLTLRDSIAVY